MKNVISNSTWSLKWSPPESNKAEQEGKKIWRSAVGFLVAAWNTVLLPMVSVFMRQDDGLEQWRRLEFNKPLSKGNRNKEGK